MDESLARDIMVMICEWYICEDVNASAHSLYTTRIIVPSTIKLKLRCVV